MHTVYHVDKFWVSMVHILH